MFVPTVAVMLEATEPMVPSQSNYPKESEFSKLKTPETSSFFCVLQL